MRAAQVGRPGRDLRDVFREVVLVIGAAYLGRDLDDAVVERLAASLRHVYRRAMARRAGKQPARVPSWLKPHPALLELLRIIDAGAEGCPCGGEDDVVRIPGVHREHEIPALLDTGDAFLMERTPDVGRDAFNVYRLEHVHAGDVL
jgi:hypothetical protein